MIIIVVVKLATLYGHPKIKENYECIVKLEIIISFVIPAIKIEKLFLLSPSVV